eukprot:SAG31_NODE_12779_length_917_cov_2.951100_1_plen_94_part_00
MQQHIGCHCVLRDVHVVATGFVASPILGVMAEIPFAVGLPLGPLVLARQRFVWRLLCVYTGLDSSTAIAGLVCLTEVLQLGLRFSFEGGCIWL